MSRITSGDGRLGGFGPGRTRVPFHQHQQFGQDEFTAMVGRVAAIEQALGVYDLARFTPDVTAYEPPR